MPQLLPESCLFNLVLCGSNHPSFSYLAQQAALLLDSFPCRLIALMVQADIEMPSNALKISIPTDKKQIAPYLLLPQLAADMPVILYWCQDLQCDKEILEALLPLSQLIVVEPGCSFDLPATAKMLLAIQKKVAVFDQSWIGCRGWRETLYRAFNSPYALEILQCIKQCSIHYNHALSPEWFNDTVQSHYLESWLKARLKWQDGKSLFTGEEISAIPPGEITKIELSQGDTFASLKRLANCDKLRCEIQTADSCPLPTSWPLFNLKRRTNFLKELLLPRPQDHYRQTLEMLASQ